MLAVPAVCALSLIFFFRNFQYMGRFENVVWVLLWIGTKIQNMSSTDSSKILPLRLKFVTASLLANESVHRYQGSVGCAVVTTSGMLLAWVN